MGTAIIVIVLIFAGELYDTFKIISLGNFANSFKGSIFISLFFLVLAYYVPSTEVLSFIQVQNVELTNIIWELVYVSLWWLIPASYAVLPIFLAGAGVQPQQYHDYKGNTYSGFKQTNEIYPELIDLGNEIIYCILICILWFKIYFFDGGGILLNRILNNLIAHSDLNWFLGWIVFPIISYVYIIYRHSEPSNKIKYSIGIALYMLILNWIFLIGIFVLGLFFA